MWQYPRTVNIQSVKSDNTVYGKRSSVVRTSVFPLWESNEVSTRKVACEPVNVKSRVEQPELFEIFNLVYLAGTQIWKSPDFKTTSQFNIRLDQLGSTIRVILLTKVPSVSEKSKEKRFDDSILGTKQSEPQCS